MMTAEQQYLELGKRLLEDGIWVQNERTGVPCLTDLNHSISISPDEFPLLTTRKCYWKQAICEMLCYIRGYTKLSDFHALGVHTWDANAEGWTQIGDYNHELGRYDRVPSTGIIYGASAEAVGMNFTDVLTQINNKPHDRGHIWNFWNPEYFNKGCLRPCMYSHQFNVLDNTLYLTSTQRSCDVPLGLTFNMIQVWFLNMVTAHLLGLNRGYSLLNIVNAHIYKPQYELFKEQLTRSPFQPPKFIIKKDFILEDIMKNITKDNFDEYFGIEDYQHHPTIKYPFTA